MEQQISVMQLVVLQDKLHTSGIGVILNKGIHLTLNAVYQADDNFLSLTAMFSQFIINFAIASRWLARHLNIKKRYAYLVV